MELDLSDLEGAHLVDRFVLKQLLGRGGYGAVFEATQKSIGRRCAVKVLAHHDAESDRVVKRFVSEAQAMSKLSHPNTIVIYDFGHDPERDILFLAMEYLEGKDLRQFMDAAPLSVPDALHILQQMARSLDDAHQNGIIHRDVKPHNVMITRRGKDNRFATMIDFGIAKALRTGGNTIAQLTATGTIIGTPTYMSPEQIRNDDLDGRSDQYSLAVCAFKMLTGRAPFEGASLIEVATKHITDRPPRLKDLSPRLPVDDVFEGAIAKALSKDAPDRYDSVIEFISALEAAWSACEGHVAPAEGTDEMTEPLVSLRFERQTTGVSEQTTENMTAPTGAPTRGPSEPSLMVVTGAVPPGSTPPQSLDDVDPGVIPFTQSTEMPELGGGTRVIASPVSSDPERVPQTKAPWRLGLVLLAITVVGLVALGAVYQGDKADLPPEPVEKSAIVPVEVPEIRDSKPTGVTKEMEKKPPIESADNEKEAAGEAPKAASAKEEPALAEDSEGSVAAKKKAPSKPKPVLGKVKAILVPWGELYVDGRRRGSKTRQTLELSAGRHRLTLRQRGEEKASKVVDVKPGETKMVTLKAQ